MAAWTTAAFAWPRVAFITAPTRKPIACPLPARTSSTAAGLAARTSSMIASSAPASEILPSPRSSMISLISVLLVTGLEDLLGVGPRDPVVEDQFHEGQIAAEVGRVEPEHVALAELAEQPEVLARDPVLGLLGRHATRDEGLEQGGRRVVGHDDPRIVGRDPEPDVPERRAAAARRAAPRSPGASLDPPRAAAGRVRGSSGSPPTSP